MNSRKIARSGIVLVVSTLASWIGAALDHGNWFGATSTIFGVIGLIVGIYIAVKIDNYVDI
jgi:hypothetical protein